VVLKSEVCFLDVEGPSPTTQDLVSRVCAILQFQRALGQWRGEGGSTHQRPENMVSFCTGMCFLSLTSSDPMSSPRREEANDPSYWAQHA
jgi:hypothetical protein